MIRRLLALLRREQPRGSGAARLGDLLLVVTRRLRPPGAGRAIKGRAIARTKIARYRVSLHDSSQEIAERSVTCTLNELLDRVGPGLDGASREELFEFVSTAATPYLGETGGVGLLQGLRILRDRLVMAELPKPRCCHWPKHDSVSRRSPIRAIPTPH